MIEFIEGKFKHEGKWYRVLWDEDIVTSTKDDWDKVQKMNPKQLEAHRLEIIDDLGLNDFDDLGLDDHWIDQLLEIGAIAEE